MIWTSDYIKRNLDALINDFNAGEVVLFIGAGISKMAGFPTWEELLNPLKIQLTNPPSKPIEIAELYVKQKGRHLLNKYLKTQLASRKINISKAHKIIASLPLDSIVTLNFDESIEETFKRYSNAPFQKIVTNKDIAYLKRNATDGIPVIKMNGCISDVDTIILIKKDFNTYVRNHLQLKTHIEDLVASKTFLFLGTSFRDPVFIKFNIEVLNTLKFHKRPAYLLALQSTPKQKADLKKIGIQVIDLELTNLAYAESSTTKFLENLYLAATGSIFEEQTPQSNLKIIQDERIGCGLSLDINPNHVDETHIYLKIFRQDLLDYKSGDFYSLRRIKIKNATNEDSPFMIYSESTENKCRFRDTHVKAYGFRTKKPLLVESFEDPNKPMLTHAFRIYFPKPLKPDETFELIFTIKMPGELKKLSKNKEVMSISLTRIKKGVEKLEFNVCLNFKPSKYYIEYVNVNFRKLSFNDVLPTLDKYKPKYWFEKKYRIKWSSRPYIISWNCANPSEKGYFINYQS